jgi:hypothetical protein
VIEAIRVTSAGKTPTVAGEGPVKARSPPRGDVVAVWATAGQPGGKGWPTAMSRAPAIAKLAADTRPPQLSSFEQAGLARFTRHDYPNARLAACRSPAQAVTAGPCSGLPKASRAPITASVLTGADGTGPQGRPDGLQAQGGKRSVITITDTTIRSPTPPSGHRHHHQP